MKKMPAIRLPILRWTMLVSLLFLLPILSVSRADDASERNLGRVKVALISKCLQYVEWPAQDKNQEVRIGLLGADDETAELFGEMARNVTVGGRTVKIVRMANTESIKGINALYVDPSLSENAPQIWKSIEKKGIFLVTDQFRDRKYVMLNLVFNEERRNLSFEINRANAVIEGFTVKPDLLLLGGSEVDVRALYKKMRADLVLEEENVRKKEALLGRLEANADSMNRKIDQYNARIREMENTIKESGVRMAGQEAQGKRLSEDILRQQGILAAKASELDRQITVLHEQKQQIETKKTSIARMHGEIEGLSSDITRKESQLQESKTRIEKQAMALKQQDVRLTNQHNLILFSVSSSLLLLALGGAVFAAYRIKRIANENLELNVRKRTEELKNANLHLENEIREKESAHLKQKELEARLQQAEKLKSIGQLAGGIAHDFNNQLGGILGFADLLREKLADKPDLRDFAETIITLVGRSKDLTQQLLAFARKGQYRNIPVDVHQIIVEVLTLLDRTVRKNIIIRSSFCSEAIFTKGDPSQLQNAILNLAINARDAMPKGGEIVFTTSIVKDPHGTEHFESVPGTYIRIAIQDSGTGIDEETMKHIFEPFFTTKEIGQGTGMGLAAVFGTVQAHKGLINVASEIGVGSLFSLYLPLIVEPESAGTGDGSGSQRAPAARPLSILLVDDEKFMRDLSVSIFQSMGHTISVCENGTEAMELYRHSQAKFDLVSLDMVMPGMNGKELFIKLKEINPDVVAILASGYSTNSDVQEILALGVKGFIPKPFNKGEMQELIGSIFRFAAS